jgi:hypothetical protein
MVVPIIFIQRKQKTDRPSFISSGFIPEVMMSLCLGKGQRERRKRLVPHKSKALCGDMTA